MSRVGRLARLRRMWRVYTTLRTICGTPHHRALRLAYHRAFGVLAEKD